MDGKRQFSLRYLLLLVFCWALALALTRHYWLLVKDREHFPIFWITAAGLAWCVAIAATFFNLRFGLRLAVRIAFPMVACLLWINGTFGHPPRLVTLLIVLVVSGTVVGIADAASDAYRRRHDGMARQE
jgi:hypothetical protein